MARILIRQAHGGATRIISDGALPYFLNQGYVVLETLDDDTDASPLYLSAAEGDLRWAKISDLGDPASAEVAVISEAVADVLVDPASGPGADLEAAFGTAPNPNDTGYDIVMLLGQSNMQGDSGGSVSSVLDVTDSRIFSYAASGTYAAQIAQASDPLGQRSGATVVGPGMSFARWYAGTIPGTRRVLLVPAAAGGTAFGSGTMRWDPTTAWPNDSNNLYNLAITQAQGALSAAGANSRIVAALWVQGETDAQAGMSGTTYRTYLEQLIDGLRTRLSLPDLPFVIGSMLPEFIAANSANAAIDAIHQATPNRKRYTAYVVGPSGMQRGDNLHYSPAGQREQGRRLVAGLATAQANPTPVGAVADAPPASPLTALTNTVAPAISGTPTTGEALTVSNGTWVATPDSYSYQWTRDGAAISGATSSSYTLVTADEGHAISCKVTAVKSGYANGTASSNVLTATAVGVTTYASDGFTRADGALGSTPTGGFAWTTNTGVTATIVNQQAKVTTYNVSMPNDVFINDGQSDGTISLRLSSASAGSAGLLFRLSGTNNATGYLLWNNAGIYTLSKRTAAPGTYTAIGTLSGVTAAANDVISVVLNGSSITCKVNGVTGLTVTDATYTGTRHGFWPNPSVNIAFDDFSHTSATA